MPWSTVDPRNDHRDFKKLPYARWAAVRPIARSASCCGKPAARAGRPGPGRRGILGQSAIALSMNTYIHVAPEVSRDLWSMQAWPGIAQDWLPALSGGRIPLAVPWWGVGTQGTRHMAHGRAHGTEMAAVVTNSNQ